MEVSRNMKRYKTKIKKKLKITKIMSKIKINKLVKNKKHKKITTKTKKNPLIIYFFAGTIGDQFLKPIAIFAFLHIRNAFMYKIPAFIFFPDLHNHIFIIVQIDVLDL